MSDVPAQAQRSGPPAGAAPQLPALCVAFRELGVLAEGGMAVVAKGVTDDGVDVVVKRVRPPFCFDASFLRLFEDEGAIHAALLHPNIVRLLGKGQDDAGPFLLFEHVDGTDLDVLLGRAFAEHKGLDVEAVLAIAIPLLKALQCAHECVGDDGASLEVVHRDVSPGNILLGKDGTVKLADFGVATSTLKNERTVAGELKGKFAYMAPEQTRGEAVTARTDLFAVGVVLHECLCGARLFDGPTDTDVVQAVRTAEAPALAHVPPALSALVAELLRKDPEQRPASARVVHQRLTEIAVSLGFDEGLARQVARLARSAPERTPTPLAESRRRTLRVLAPAAGAPVLRARPRWVVPASAAGALAAIAAVTLLLLPAPKTAEVVVPLADAPAIPTPRPATAPVSVAATAPVRPANPGAQPVIDPSGQDASKPSSAEGRAIGARAEVKRAAPRSVIAEPTRAAAGADIKPTPGPVGIGRLSLQSDPWAEVRVDGALVTKETPLLRFSLPAGRHTVVLRNPVHGVEKTIVVDVPADQDVRRFVDLNAP